MNLQEFKKEHFNCRHITKNKNTLSHTETPQLIMDSLMLDSVQIVVFNPQPKY